MSNPSRNMRCAPNTIETAIGKLHKRRQEMREQLVSGQHSATSAATTRKASSRRKKTAKRLRQRRPPRTWLSADRTWQNPRSRNSDDALPALVEPDDGASPLMSDQNTGTTPHPENEQDTILVQTSAEARSPVHPSSHKNVCQDTYRLFFQQTSQFSSRVPAPASSYPTSLASIMESTARMTFGSTQAQAQEVPRDFSADGEWRVVHEVGYCPVMSLSYVPPMKKDVGVFPSRADAVRKGQQLVGSTDGYTWGQVRDSGDLEIVSATSARWEICWRPPNSEYARVTATLLTPGGGRWVVDVERGFIPDGVHSYVAPTTNTLGPFQSREIAVARAKKEVGDKRGLDWVEVVRGGDFENREDSANRWEGYWEPPDSEYSHVIVKLLVPAISTDSGSNLFDDYSPNDDQQPTSSTAGPKQTIQRSSGSELPVAF